MSPFLFLLYLIGVLTISILALYFIKMTINTSDTFLDFVKKNIDYLTSLKFYNNFKANIILAATSNILIYLDVAIWLTIPFFLFFTYRAAIIYSKKQVKNVKETVKEE